MSDMNTDPQPPMSEFHRMVAEALDLAETQARAAAPEPTERPPSWQAAITSALGLPADAPLGQVVATVQVLRIRADQVAVLKADLAKAHARADKADVVADLQGQLDQITEAHAHVQAILDRMGVPAGGLAWRLNWVAEINFLEEVHKALDEVKAPPNERLVERVRWLGQRLNEAWLTRAAWMEDVRKALNIGPPSDSDVREGTSAAELVRIVRVRNELMLEERARRVALAQEVEALKRQAGQEHVKLIARLDGWMSGDETNVRRELKDQVIRAVEAGSVTAHDAINALRHRRSLAELVLAVDFGDNDIPF